MTTAAPLQRLVRKLVQAAERQPLDRLADGELLERYRTRGDADAFATIVRRHGACVLAACRKVLSVQADVEDAFQTTFLVLLRTASGIRKQASLRSWLYSVAHRIALKALRARTRRQRAEYKAPSTNEVRPDPSWREACTILHEELDRLPDSYRLPLLACYLDGMSRDEAAQQLGVKLDILRGRLERGRIALRSRMMKRGVLLSTALFAAAVGSSEAAGPSETLVRTTLIAATGGKIADSIAALLRGGASSATIGKSKVAAAAVVIVVLASAAIGLASNSAAPQAPPSDFNAGRPVGDEEKAAATEKEDALAKLDCQGRVLDPEGKAVRGAKVTFYQKRPYRELPDFYPEPANGATDADGQFRFSATFHADKPNGKWEAMFVIVAQLPGFGPAALETNSTEKLKDCVLRLVKDDVPLEGRILSLEGKPIAGVTVRPIGIVLNSANDLGPWVKARKADKWGELGNEYRTNTWFSTAAVGLTPKAVTDENGKFKLTGFGRERIVVLRVDGPTVATCLINVLTREMPSFQESRPQNPNAPEPMLARPQTYTFHGAHFDFAPGVGMTVEGVVKDDAGKPLPEVLVRSSIAYDFGWAEDELTTTTDVDGRYRMSGMARRRGQSLEFVPKPGQPVFLTQRAVEVSDIDRTSKLDVALRHGVLVKGRVTDKATGKPLQAVVEYLTFDDNPNLRAVKGFRGSETVSSAKDGSFRLVALPGPGVVLAKMDEMRRSSYLYGQGIEQIKGFDAKQGLLWAVPSARYAFQFDAIVEIDADAKADAVNCELRLDPGKTVKGSLLDPDGKPLAGASIRGPFGSSVNVRDLATPDFALTAINPAKPEAYFFHHHKKNLAAAVILKGDEPSDFTIKLQPAASATGRLLTEDGVPAKNVAISTRVEAGQLNLVRSWNGLLWAQTDQQGKFTIEGLIPGVSFAAEANGGRAGFAAIFEKLALKPGEKHDVGDIKLKAR